MSLWFQQLEQKELLDWYDTCRAVNRKHPAQGNSLGEEKNLSEI